MATFAIDLLSGKQFLFNGNYTGSGTTVFSGITSASNGLTATLSHNVNLGGALCCATTLTAINGTSLSFADSRTVPTGIQYAGDYSTSYTDRSLVDKEYVINIFNVITGTTLPSNYYNQTQINSYTGETEFETINLQNQIDNLSQLQSGLIYYPAHIASDIVGYERMTKSQLTSSGHTQTVAINNNTVLIDAFITDVNEPTVTGYTSGIWTVHTHGQFSSHTGNNFIIWSIYKRTTGGTETLLYTVSTDNITVNTLVEYQFSYLLSGATMNVSDRLIMKIYAQTTGGAKNVSILYGGTSNFAFLQPNINETVSPLWSSILAKPQWLSGTTLGDFETGHTHSQYITTGGITPLVGTKIYYVSDTSSGATTRKLTFTNGILTSET